VFYTVLPDDEETRAATAEGLASAAPRLQRLVGAEVRLAQFLPEHGLNPALLEAYGRNVLRVVPEVAYSAHGAPGRLDLVLFVNGVPTATLELKSEFTQSVAKAVTQYRQDRPPVDPGSKKREPLLSFKRGALVHFAVSQSNVMMTTHLAGRDTTFLPFDRGREDGGAGNPPNPGGYDTAYLWERVLARDAWLQIVGRFVHLQEAPDVDAKGRERVKEALIFPRYHQWDAVTKLVGAARVEGPGRRYLVQHSAGSGKSTFADALAAELGYDYVSGGDIFRSLADERGHSLVEFNRLAEEDDQVDRDLDRRLREIASVRDDVVLESRLAGWMAGEHADLRVWLDAPIEVRAERIADREATDTERSLEETRTREASERARYREYYGIDFEDRSIYDIAVNTARWDVQGVTGIVASGIEAYEPAADEGAVAVNPEYGF
jgi:predicted cytidylate kinase